METVRVRRAGFCNRQPYDRFLKRYKLVTPHTWPTWRGVRFWRGICDLVVMRGDWS